MLLFLEKLGNRVIFESNQERSSNFLDIQLPITDATPAIQSALQNLRQGFNNLTSTIDLPCPPLEPVNPLKRFLLPLKVEPIRTLEFPSTQGSFSFAQVYPTTSTEFAAETRASYSTLDLPSSILPLNQDLSLGSASPLSTSAWHTPTITLKEEQVKSNDVQNPSKNSNQLQCQNSQFSTNRVDSIKKEYLICSDASGPLENSNIETPKYLDETYRGMKANCITSIKPVRSLNELSQYEPLIDSHPLKLNDMQQENINVKYLENMKAQSSATIRIFNDVGGLSASFSLPKGVAPAVTEASQSASPLPALPLYGNEHVFKSNNNNSIDSLNESGSDASNINVSLIENFEDTDVNMDDPEEENNLLSFTGIEDSPFDLPLCSTATTSSYHTENTQTPELPFTIDANNVRSGGEFYLTSPSMRNNFMAGWESKSPTNSSTDVYLDGKSISPVDFAGLGPTSVYSADSSNQSPLHLTTGIPKHDENKKMLPSKNLTFEKIPSSLCGLRSTNIPMQVLTFRDKTLDYFQASDLKSGALPSLLHDSMLSNMDDKCDGISSVEFSTSMLNGVGPTALPSLDHPLDFENLMDLDNLPFEK